MNRLTEDFIEIAATLLGKTVAELRALKSRDVRQKAWPLMGLCRFCGDKEGPGTRGVCYEHAAADRMGKANRRIAAGKGVRESTKTANGAVTCRKLPRIPEMALAMGVMETELVDMGYLMRRYRWHRHLGLCGMCHAAPLEGLTVCQKHRSTTPEYDPVRRREFGMKSRALKRERGICYNCKDPVVPGRSRCARHAARDHEQYLRKKNREAGHHH
jgi:hypothetical protein